MTLPQVPQPPITPTPPTSTVLSSPTPAKRPNYFLIFIFAAAATDYYSKTLPERGWQGNLAKKGNGYEGEWVFSDRKKAFIMIWPAFSGTLTNILVLEGSK